MNWRVIKSEKEYHLALKRLEEIFDVSTGDPRFKEAELLVMLIEQYETSVEPPFPDPHPIEVIKFKMEQNNLKNEDLADILGGVTTVEKIMNKQRKLRGCLDFTL